MALPERSGSPHDLRLRHVLREGLPQPIGAVVAFAFVRVAREFLPYGFGFAAGAMIYLVLTEFVPEALDTGADLPGGGKRELGGGIAVGVVAMLPLAVI